MARREEAWVRRRLRSWVRQRATRIVEQMPVARVDEGLIIGGGRALGDLT
jgi:hypothetical protein